MNKFKKIITIAFSVAFPLLAHAQENDGIPVQNRDTIPVNLKQHSCLTAKIIGIAVPPAMIAYGAISLGDNGVRRLDYSVKNKLVENNSLWNNSWDDYLQYSPAAAAFGMKLSGVESRHKIPDMVIIYALCNVLETGTVHLLKRTTLRQRPDGSNLYSFPSGHTATAFVAAEFLHQEYEDKSVWISVGGYSMAALTGISRVCNNKHWVSDVLAGAGIGILSTKVVYWTYPHLQKVFSNGKDDLQVFICPAYAEGRLGVNTCCRF